MIKFENFFKGLNKKQIDVELLSLDNKITLCLFYFLCLLVALIILVLLGILGAITSKLSPESQMRIIHSMCLLAFLSFYFFLRVESYYKKSKTKNNL